uniref:Uncharacterized protein n=1 Tax=Rhizophora mucronata TaxID=61149 RepID=A0A2P2QIZ8_RHIMU
MAFACKQRSLGRQKETKPENENN